jgi:hypothetical protein
MPRLDGCFAHFHDFLVPFPIIVPSNPFHHQVFEFDVGDKVEVTSSPQIGGNPGSWEIGCLPKISTHLKYVYEVIYVIWYPSTLPIYLTTYLSIYLPIFILYIYIFIHIYILYSYYIYIHVGASINVGIPKWMVLENPTNMEWFGRTPISGNLHV